MMKLRQCNKAGHDIISIPDGNRCYSRAHEAKPHHPPLMNNATMNEMLFSTGSESRGEADRMKKKMHTQFVIVNWLLADYEMYWNEECKYKNQLWDGRRRHINSIIEQQLQCVTRKWWRVFVTFAWAFLPEMMRHLYGLVPMSAICPQSSELKFWSPARSSDSLIIVTKHELRQLFKHLYICFTSIVGRAFIFWHRRQTDGKVAARRCWSGWTK